MYIKISECRRHLNPNALSLKMSTLTTWTSSSLSWGPGLWRRYLREGRTMMQPTSLLRGQNDEK